MGTKAWIMLTSGHPLPNGAKLCQELLIGSWSYCCVNKAGVFISWLTNGEYALWNKGYLMTTAHRVAWIIIVFGSEANQNNLFEKCCSKTVKEKLKRSFTWPKMFSIGNKPVIFWNPFFLPLFVFQNSDLLIDKVLPSNIQCWSS